MVALALAFAMASFALPSRAGTIISISMVNAGTETSYEPVFDPRVPLPVAAGVTLTWTHLDGVESHQIESYYGQAFGSPRLARGDSFSVTYAGGTLLYRCVLHSTLEKRFVNGPPVCTGMCGAIHDASDDAIPPAISITTKNGFVFTGAVRIDGVASDNRAVVEVRVRIIPVIESPPTLQTRGGFSDAVSAMNPCGGCDGPKAAWVVRQLADINTSSPVLSLPPGQYRVEASAFDPHDNEGVATPISIYVLR
ncbi:MAG: hypothetical protein NVSMB57_16660 [Actinomycetota bacterium]